MHSIDDDLRAALQPFIMAAAVGHSVEADVEAAKPRQHSSRPLLGFAGYAGHYAAQSRVSWADWKRLLEAYDKAGLLQDDMDARALNSNGGAGK